MSDSASKKGKVAVTMTCGTNDFSLKVDPWHVSVKKGRPLKWELSGPTGSTIKIEPQDPGTWPLDAGFPLEGNPNVPVDAGIVKGTAVKGSTHKYSIVLKCDGRTFDIDPDIYILD